MTFIDTSNAIPGVAESGLSTTNNSLSEPFDISQSPSSILAAPLRVEAEAMTLENYRVERIDFASGGAVASFVGGASAERGSASLDFSGQAGTYDIVLGYFDEAGGRAELDPRLNDQSLGSFRLDQELGSKFATPDNLIRRRVGDNVALQAGDRFSVRGLEEGGEHARLDYIEFIWVDETPSQASPNSFSGGAIESDAGESGTIRINSGGDRYTDREGNIWQADSFFDDGWTNNRNNSIQNTPDDPLYQSERYAKTLDYSVSVANGTYTVNLLFAETYWSEAGQRSFDVNIEGRSVIENLDIYQEVGKFQALNKQIENVTVTDGRLDIALDSDKDYANLSGFEIIPINSSTENDAEQTPSASDNNGSNAPEPRPLSSNATIRYISPNGSGDGSSWDKAARIEELNNLIERSNPGDEIWIAGDLGTYYMGSQDITLRNGSDGSAPIYIRGAASQQGRNETPLFVGDRAENWQPGRADGTELFRLLSGANHLHFSGLNFKDIGNGVFKFGDDVTGVTLQDMEVDNVRRFVENDASGGAQIASVTDLTIRDIDVRGFSKGAIRLQYNSNNILIEDVFGDAEGQDGDNFTMGIQLTGSVHNVLHRNVTMNNAIQTGSDAEYWNADGFVTEWGTYDITYENTFAAGSTDGGYDLKSRNTTLINAGAADNKRNFRIWNDATLINVSSDEPRRRGGTGTTAHINILENANVTVRDGTFSGDQDINNIIFDLDDRGRLTVESATITDDDYVLSTVEQGDLSLNNVREP